MIVDSNNVVRFCGHVNGKLSSETGVGPICKSDGNFAVRDKEKADEWNNFFISVCTADDGVVPEYILKGFLVIA
jgi:hypothetical protein